MKTSAYLLAALVFAIPSSAFASPAHVALALILPIFGFYRLVK